MKFRKEFKKQMVAEWTEAYMDYDGLKSILQEISSHKQSKQLGKPLQKKLSMDRTFGGLNRQPSCSTNGEDIDGQVIDVNALQKDDSRQFYKTEFPRQSEEGGDVEASFFRKLDEELNKVNTFYRDRVEEVMDEANLLNRQMDALIALRIKVENHGVDSSRKPPSSDIPLRKFDQEYAGSQNKDTILEVNNQREDGARDPEVNRSYTTHYGNEEARNINGSREDPLQILERVKINNTLESPMSTLKGVFKDSRHDELSFNKDELEEAEERLRHVFIEFYQKLCLLQRYSFMNLSAFSEIMTKYEVITSRRASRSYMKIVENSYIGSSEEVNNLLEGVEAIFIKHFANSDSQKGLKSLRPQAKKEKHRVTFFSGFFAGCLTALLTAVFLTVETRNLMDKKEGTSYMVNVFPLYSIFGYVVLHMLMFTADLYFWRRYRVNYPFIFGLKQGTELGYREVFLLSTGLAVLTLASFLANLHLDLSSKSQNSKTLTELLPLALVVIVLLIICCPFNILYRSSRFFFIKSLFHCICAPLYKVTLPDFLLADNLTSQIQAIRSFDLYICYYGLEFSQRQNKCHKHGVYNALYFIIAVIPFWIRFLQCLRRFCEDKHSMHGYNGLKHFLTIVAVLTRTACEVKKGKIWTLFALISSAVAIVINTYWDIVVDWGLLRIHSKNVYLRERLLVPHKGVYFAAMVLNTVLRVAWMQLVLEFNLHSLHKMAVTTIISCLEIIRRGIWTFFRLENEHLNNVGKYRAFKSIPLPFSYDDKDHDKGD